MDSLGETGVMTRRSEIPEGEEYLTPLEAARLLQLSTDRVRQLDDVLRPIRTTSGRRFYRAVDVEALATARKHARPDAAASENSSSVRR
jgi:hypothetical protein